MKISTLIVALLAIALNDAAYAADRAGNYAIWGVGARSCNQFVKAAESEEDTLPFRHYLMGYLTAFNALAPDTYDALSGMKLGAALEWLADYCGGHRMDSFERAVAQAIVSRQDEVARESTPGNSWGRAPAGRKTPP